MTKRIMTSIIFVLVVALAFVLKMLVPYGDYFFDALLLGATCFAAFEMTKLLKGMDKPCYKYAAVAFPVVLYVNHLLGFLYDAQIGLGWVVLIDVCLIVLCFALAFAYGVATVKTLQKEIRFKKLENVTPMRLAFNKAFNTGLAFVYPALLFMTATLVNHLADFSTAFEGFGANNLKFLSMFALLLLFVVAASTDTFAYLCGKLIGGKKLCPKISPEKTIAGAVGGFVWCILLSTCAYFVLCTIPAVSVAFQEIGIQFWHVIIFAALGSIFAQAGDLFESFLKRRAGVKDSGKLLPGHGGMLDRLDSYIFLAPAILICFSILLVCL